METSLVSFLAPFLPFLVDGARSFATDVAEGIGAEAAGYASSLWEKLRPGLEARPAGVEATTDVVKDPTDSMAQAALALQIRKVLDEDAALRDEVGALLDKATRVSTSATTIHVSGGMNVERGSAGIVGTVHGNMSIGDRGSQSEKRP